MYFLEIPSVLRAPFVRTQVRRSCIVPPDVIELRRYTITKNERGWNEFAEHMVLRRPWPGKTGSMAVLVFAVKSVFGWNVLLLMSSFFQEVRLACEDRFTAINFGQIQGSVVQVRASVRRLRGCKLDF